MSFLPKAKSYIRRSPETEVEISFYPPVVELSCSSRSLELIAAGAAARHRSETAARRVTPSELRRLPGHSLLRYGRGR